ncbi:M23 family metallopeptidase [Terricaulis silvestris]|uniref:Membrane-bound metallopeptidase n=1 Tax=Terricaulis silvestris TaxID=2686094 RepID=A0A6I6MIT8_9CAUL|nr:M23 family metallopeptidase [Terricaulis silvestris]QGZ95065.1 Membrane-bound metallopeptidase [Terricaulis silvestris]
MRRLIVWCAFVLAFVLSGQAAAQDINARISPELPYAEPVRQGQALNFDVIVANQSQAMVELSSIEVTYLDARGSVLFQREADANGSNPSINTMAGRVIGVGEGRMFFNPFPVIAPELAVSSARVRMEFSVEGQDATLEVIANRDVRRDATVNVRLPLRGNLLVWSAHDLMAHHRRFDYAIPDVRAFGINSNSGRYGYDFVMLDSEGRRFVGDENDAENWVGFNAPVMAPGDGVVVEVRSDMPDNGEWDQSQIPTDPNIIFGNHIIIEHAPGQFFVLAHLRQNSPSVRVGERVRQGQVIAALGHSGSSLFPHLHFQAIDSPSFLGEGIPSNFENFDRLAGGAAIRVRRGSVETGDYVRPR